MSSSSRDDFGIVIRSALLQRGAKQKFSLFFLISLSILIFFLDSFPSKIMDRTRSILNDGIYMVSSIAASPIRGFTYITEKVELHIFTYNENKILKEELKKIKEKSFKVEFLSTENRNLKKALESSQSTLESNVDDNITARVLIDKESPFLRSIVLSRGSRSGIKKGMPVIDNSFLVGRIVEVNYLSSRVLLLSDLNSRIPIVIDQSGVHAILSGTGDSKPKLEYLPEGFELKEGATVFTSGKDGIFPNGIPIGKTIILDDLLYVELFSISNQLSFVNVILTDLETKKRY